MSETNKNTWTISELANELNITTRTIRYYEEVGLVEPQYQRGQRVYGGRERARLKLILRGKRLGFSLAEIKEMIDLYDEDPTEKEQLKRAIAYGERRLREIDEMIKELYIIHEEISEYHQEFLNRLMVLEAKERPVG
ncbi:MAG: MerR family DNA-binding transcriptional regulator [Desulfitobacterium sp.]|nr:MerR family DNA-binding transcriptional regulator [Desulfitobacterium sp.]